MNKRVFGALALAAGLALLLTQFPGTAGAAQAKELLVGEYNVMSGPGAPWGLGYHRGAEIAMDEINARGGITVKGEKYLLRLKVRDDKYTGSEATKAVSALIYQDKARFIIGSIGSTSVLAARSIGNREKVLNIADGAVWNIVDKEFPYTFRVHGISAVYAAAMYDWIGRNWPEVKTISLITADTESGVGTMRDIRKWGVDKIGLEVLTEDRYQAGTKDFYPLLSKVLAKNPDAIDTCGSMAGDGATMWKQLHELGFKGRKICSFGVEPDLMLQVAGKEAAEGILEAYTDPTSPLASPSLVRLYEEYLKRHGAWQYVAVSGYSAAMALAAGLEKAQSLEPTDVMHAMESPDFVWESAMGPAKFTGEKTWGIRRHSALPCAFVIFKDGKVETLEVVSGERVAELLP